MRPRPDQLRLVESSRALGGLFTRAVAGECGFSPGQIRRRLHDGRWQVVLGSVLAPGGLRVTSEVRDRAVLLAVPNAVLSGASALRANGIESPDPRTWITVPRDRTVRLPGIHVRRESLSEGDVTSGARRTTLPRAVFDTLRALPLESAEKLLDRGLQQRWITFDDLVRRVHDHAGCHGVGKLVELVCRSGPGARSAAERALLAELRRARMTGWRTQCAVYDEDGLVGEVDVGFEAIRLAVEVDGRAWHSAGDRFEHDRVRQNRLVRAGWTVLRFTWRDLNHRPERVIAEIKAVISRTA